MATTAGHGPLLVHRRAALPVRSLEVLPVGFFGYPSYPEKFAAWGYPSWFSFIVGACEIFAGVLLILPRRRFLGAAVMLFILTGAIATHIINRDSVPDSIAAPVILVLSLIIALATWPADWREPLGFGQREREALSSSQPRGLEVG